MRAIVVWEEANGVPFPKGKFPHHDNEITTDDRADNIRPMTRPEHSRLHGKRRGGLNGQGKQSHEVKDNVESEEQRNQNRVGGPADS